MLDGAFSVDGLVGIITGGGTGIGKAIAKFFAENGAKVSIASRNIEHLASAKEEIDRTGGRCLIKTADVKHEDQVKAMVEGTLKEFGRIDILVNNAGASFVAPAAQISVNGLESILAINLKGAIYCSKAVFPVMLNQKRGKIINISSIAGIYGAPLMSHYGAAKAAMINLTKSLAYEWGPFGVWVNCIAPGMIETMGVFGQMHIGPDQERKAKEKVPIRRWGKPEEIAYLALFLASRASDYVQGETIVIDGGPQMPLEI